MSKSFKPTVVDKSTGTFTGAYGIADDRANEIVDKVKEVVAGAEDSVDVISQVSDFANTPEEFAFGVFIAGEMVEDKKHSALASFEAMFAGGEEEEEESRD